MLGLAVIGSAIAIFVSIRLDYELKRCVITELQKHFPHLQIDVGSVSIEESKGVLVRRLRFFERETENQEKRLVFSAENIFLETSITPSAVLKGEYLIDKFTISQPKIFLSLDEKGRIREAELLKPNFRDKGVDDVFPSVLIENGSLIINGNEQLLHGLSIAFSPPDKRQPQKGVPEKAWTFRLESSSEYLRNIQGNGFYDPENAFWWLSGAVKKGIWSKECVSMLSQIGLINENAYIEHFSANVEFSFEACRDIKAEHGFRFAINGQLSDGRFSTDCISNQTNVRSALGVLRNPLFEMQAAFQLTDDSVAVDNFTARIGATRIALSYRQEGLNSIRKADLSTQIKQLRLDSEMLKMAYPMLSPKMTEFFDDVDFSATTDVSAFISYEGKRWKPKRMYFKAHDLNLCYDKFPYPISHLAGELLLNTDETLSFRFINELDPKKTLIDGFYEEALTALSGAIRIQGTDVQIDETLIHVLRNRHLESLLQLHPQGKFDANLTIAIPKDKSAVRRHFEITAKGCSIQYDKFPYPLRNINGLLTMDNNVWSFNNLTGTNESAIVSGEGHFTPIPDGHELFLNINTKCLPLDGDIVRSLLEPNKRQLLLGLHAKGKVDLQAQIRYYPKQNNVNLAFDIELGDSSDPVSVHPQHFPCRVENVKGHLRYEDGNIVIRQFQGRNKEMHLDSDVQINFAKDGSWQLTVSPLSITQILPTDRELRSALPENVQLLMSNFQLAGPFNVDGEISISKGSGPNSPLKTHWNTAFTLYRNSFNMNMAINNVNGRIFQSGSYAEGEKFEIEGRLELDSVMIGDIQLTEITGPFSYDGQRLLFGQNANTASSRRKTFENSLAYRGQQNYVPAPVRSRFADAARPKQTPQITSKLFGGNVSCFGWAKFDKTPSFRMNITLKEADLTTAVSEIMPHSFSSSEFKGQLFATADLGGESWRKDTLSGFGKIALRNADIYKTPTMLQLLQVLSVQPPQKSAFSESDMDFRLIGNNVIFDTVSFQGGLFSLTGNGEMRLDNQALNMILSARIAQREMPALSALLGGASDQLTKIQVDGHLTGGGPRITQIPFPGVRGVFQRFNGAN